MEAGMENYEEAIKMMAERFSKDSLIALVKISVGY